LEDEDIATQGKRQDPLLKKFIVSVILTCATAGVSQTACSNIPLGDMAPLNGFVPSPSDAWHQDISIVPVDKLSSWILTSTADLGGGHLSANFSSVAGGNFGIPYTVVDSQSTPGIALPVTLNPLESDMTLVPIPSLLPVEQSTGQCPLTGTTRRAIILDRNQCVVYEIYHADQCTTGAWTGSNLALWDLTTTQKRPYGYASADAAGLSIFEGLIRYDEIVAGVINHAIRFTASNTQLDAAKGLFAAPATHAAGTIKGTDNVMGMRLRLKANYDISSFSTTNQIILTALKKYGMILADNGPNLSIGGTPDSRWNDTDLAALTNVVSSGLEVVQMGTLYDATTAPKGAAPVIASFTASSTNIPAGSSVTLTPTVTGASYSYIDNAGFTRGPITVSPAATTTYTLTSRNQFGTASASVTVTVGGTQTVPTLTFAAIPAQTFGVAPFAVSASSQSTGAITYSIVSGPATIAGSTVTVTGIGTVVVNATQAAAGTYGAGSATTSFNVSAANAGLAFVAIPNVSYSTTPLTVSTTTSSTGSITYSVASGPATIAGNQVTLTGIGTVTLQANQVAAGNYLAGVATTSFNVLALNPQLTIAPILNQILNIAPFLLTSTSLSTAPITYTVKSGNATILGNLITLLGTGTITIQASQAAAGNYLSAVATTSFSVGAGLLVPNLAFTAITTQTFGVAPFSVHASSASTGAVTYSVVSGPATISGSTVTLTGVGTVALRASQAATLLYTAATATTSFQVVAPIVAGGKVAVPVMANATVYVHVSQAGNAYLMNTGATSNAKAGLWVASATACEASPTTCTWKTLKSGEPASGGSFVALREMLDIDSTHELGIFGFSGAAGACSNCSIQILNTTTNTYKKITLPGQPAGESPSCLAHDSNGIFYTMLNYHAGIWKSTDNTATTWTEVTTDYTTLPGLAGSGGNIYTCTAFANRIYFGGEGGVISCDLTFTSCSEDYLPFGSGKRNFLGILADVDAGSATAPTMMLECCKQDSNVTNYVPYSRYANGTWTQLTTASGLPEWLEQWWFDVDNLAVGTGTARRYYLTMINTSTLLPSTYVSTDSTGTSFKPFKPSQWPTPTVSYSQQQLTSDPRNGSVWTVFEGSSTSGLYITP
jgi:hypothetical protein